MIEGILLRRGTLLFSEEVYAATLLNNCRSTLCSYCFTKNKLFYCMGCRLHRYCNKECQAKDWIDHKNECKIFRRIPMEDRVQFDYHIHLIIRIIFKLERESTKNPEKLISYCNEKIKLNKYKFMDLKEHFLEEMKISGSKITSLLELIKDSLPKAILDKYEYTMPHIWCKITTNSFYIRDEHRQEIGVGIFLNSSKYNHNCVPNGIIISNGRTQHLVLIEDLYLPNANDLEKYVRISYRNPLATTYARQLIFKNTYNFTCDCSLCCPDKTQNQSSNSMEDEFIIDITDECLPKYDFQESNSDLEQLQSYQELYFNGYLTKKILSFGQKSNAISFPVSMNIVYNTILQKQLEANMIVVRQNITKPDGEAMINFKITYEMCRALENGHILKKNYGKYSVYLAIHWYRMAVLSKVLDYNPDLIIYKNKCLEILDAAYPLTQLNEPMINRSIIGTMRKFYLPEIYPK
ncbi:histone-lysine N-methyltransferase SMYD3-like [Gordionus sp. m RMFG-2023]|uniref:histone-lysine N-methyltransferase SMYD3-like n=1 Tax=Gordionus sp. m RMFG-2023 TaxID=3053472 RepID=UPI0031FE2320